MASSRRGRPIRRGRGGRVPVPGRKRVVAKPPQLPKAWETFHQKETLSKLLAILQPTKSKSSQTNPATVEYYYVSDIIPFLVSGIGKLTNKPSTKSQLHDAIKKLLLEDPEGASAPPVDAVYLFCKLLSEGLISLSIKQEVCYFYPFITNKKEEFAVPQTVQEWSSKAKTQINREKAKSQTLKQIDRKVASILKSAWRSKQVHWMSAQATYFEKFHKELEGTQKYRNLEPHYQRVKQWVQKILQKKKEQHNPSQESNNNNNNEEENQESVIEIEFHTHSTSWNFLHTLIKLFRVTRVIDDKLVEELIQAMVEDGMLQIEEEQLRYLNKPPQKAPGVPPITPKVTCLFASTPQAFWEHNRVTVGRQNLINAQSLATLLRLVGNPSTTVSQKVAPSPVTAPTQKEGNIFASLAEEIDVATGKAPKADEPEPEAPKPTPAATPAKDKEPTNANDFTTVSSKKKKGKNEPEPKSTSATSTSTTTTTTTSVAMTSSYATLGVDEEKDQPKKKMSSKKKVAALAETKSVPAPEETKSAREPAKETHKETPLTKTKEIPAKPATPAKPSNPPVKETKSAKQVQPKGKAMASTSNGPSKPQINDNNKSKQGSTKKNMKKSEKPQSLQPKQSHHTQKRKDPPLVPPALIISCLFVFLLILAAYALRIDQFLDSLFD